MKVEGLEFGVYAETTADRAASVQGRASFSVRLREGRISFGVWFGVWGVGTLSQTYGGACVQGKGFISIYTAYTSTIYSTPHTKHPPLKIHRQNRRGDSPTSPQSGSKSLLCDPLDFTADRQSSATFLTSKATFVTHQEKMVSTKKNARDVRTCGLPNRRPYSRNFCTSTIRSSPQNLLLSKGTIKSSSDFPRLYFGVLKRTPQFPIEASIQIIRSDIRFEALVLIFNSKHSSRYSFKKNRPDIQLNTLVSIFNSKHASRYSIQNTRPDIQFKTLVLMFKHSS